MTIYPENENSGLVADQWTVQRVLTWSASWLKEKSRDSSAAFRLDAELLLAKVLFIDRMKLYLQLDRPLLKNERDDYKTLLRRRAEGEPIAYILGYRDFYRHRFKVNSNVLIPRPDTELLVELAVQFARKTNANHILDIGSGSGCVAISIASEMPLAQVVSWDISQEALLVARENSTTLGIKNVEFQLRNALELESYKGGANDVIVSNPPYISQNEQDHVSFETKTFEPGLALYTNDGDGLKFYSAIAKWAKFSLKSQGKIFLEIGYLQGEKVTQLFESAGWEKISVNKDLSGHDRVLIAERP